jgi:hypothetical protein
LSSYNREREEVMVMRAKMKVESVQRFEGREVLKMHAVAKSSGYPDDGSDEDNTFAKFTPGANLEMTISNPTLHGQFSPGQKFYVDFTAAE